MVHLEALWLVLRRMGFPDGLISLLRDWASKRRTRAQVNGLLSAEYPMSKGVPQGDPLSCLLFSLFIESLSRYLKSKDDLDGVTAFNGMLKLLLLLYADDLVVFANSPAELQRALLHTVLKHGVMHGACPSVLVLVKRKLCILPLCPYGPLTLPRFNLPLGSLFSGRTYTSILDTSCALTWLTTTLPPAL
jgi:hypothetical protein